MYRFGDKNKSKYVSVSIVSDNRQDRICVRLLCLLELSVVLIHTSIIST